MSDVEQLETLKRIETVLTAILGIQVEQFLRDTDLAKPRPRSIDRMLTDFGFHQGEVATILGKSRQAVNQSLARDDGKKSEPKKAGG